jgi:hypothetical protein
VHIKTGVSLRYQLPIEPLFTAPGFVATAQNNGLPLWIECKSEPPNAASGVKPQFLHILMSGSVESIDARTLHLWPENFQDFYDSLQLVLHFFR